MAEKPIVTILDNGRLMKYMTLNDDDELEPFYKIKKTNERGKWHMMEPPETVDLFVEGPRRRGKYVNSEDAQSIMNDDDYTKTLSSGAWIRVMDTGDMYVWDAKKKQWYSQQQ